MPETSGLLRRASIAAREIVPVGKETDRRWEQGEDMSLVEFQLMEYRKNGTMAVADTKLRRATAKIGVREMMRRTKLSQHTIEKITRSEPVRPSTLQRVLAAVGPTRAETDDPAGQRVGDGRFKSISIPNCLGT